MPSSKKQQPQNPLILRSHRLMEAFSKSDDERDFYLDRLEGFIVYIDLDKSQEELESLYAELDENADRYCLIPKLTFYETKKIMEGFVNEKVYDIDTKEKLLDIIQSKEARENFLEFIYDHHSELEKWQQYYQERSRIRIIEWLRQNHFHFVFEEDLDLPRQVVEKLKRNLFETKAPKDVVTARKSLVAKAKTYYSSEALNPRPKRGRPPKQAVKQEVETQVTTDIYTTVPSSARPFLFIPDISSASAVTFSSKFDSDDRLNLLKRQNLLDSDVTLEGLNQKLATLRSLSNRWLESEKPAENIPAIDFSIDDDEDDEDDDWDDEKPAKKKPAKKAASKATASKKAKPTKAAAKKPAAKTKTSAKTTKKTKAK